MRTRSMRSFPVAVLLLTPMALLLTAGCASTPPPVADLSQAHTLVSQAEQSDAPRYDSADLASAQNRMQRADQEARQRPAAAARLAREASVDAELALARTRADKEQTALNQVNDSLAALREELHEAPTETPGTVPQGGPQP